MPCRVVSVGRVGRSPIRFFDLILNNALALRASHHHRTTRRLWCAAFAPFRKPDAPNRTRPDASGRTRPSGRVRTQPDGRVRPVSFSIRSVPKFHKLSLIVAENGQFSKKECTPISQTSKIAFPISKTIINRVTSRVTL